MWKSLIVLACGAMLSVGVAASSLTPAEARRGGVHIGGHGGGHVRAGRAFRGHVNRNVNINRNVARHVDRNVTRRYVYRNGVWIVAPAVAGATYVASCAYEYGRWQSTGSSYWRDRYYQCTN